MDTSTITTVPTCAPCLFGAVGTSLLSVPDSLATLSVQTTVSHDGRNPTPTTVYNTILIYPSIWITLGTTLTYPTTYVDYLSFVGAAVTGSGCASTVSPTAITIPSSVPPASLIYPIDVSGGLPAALLSYLDTQPQLIAQLNNARLETCGYPGLYSETLARTPGASSTSTQSSPLSSTVSTSSSLTVVSPSVVTQSASSLSAGASAGVGVGVAFVVILLTGLGALAFWRIRRKRQDRRGRLVKEQEKSRVAYEIDSKSAALTELDPEGLAELQQPLVELQQPLIELDSNAQRLAELRHDTSPHEMPDEQGSDR